MTTTTTSILRGPADADHYRVPVGRYRDRWYHDPLPADGVWAATDDNYPSISIVKKASGADWSFVAMKRCATTDPDRIRQIADLPTVGERYDAFTSINKRGLEQAAARGTGVHLYCEALLTGGSVELIPTGEWVRYRAAVDAFFDQHQPELVAAEYVVIHRDMNGVGYGGTPDAIVRIAGELWAVDWKSRGDDSAHGAYPEEADQIAAGLMADYMIVDTDTGPQRRPIPQVAGGLIVSIKSDGARAYPIDPAKTLWPQRHAWWCARRNERDATGKPWAPKKRAAPDRQADPPPPPTDQDRRDNLRARARTAATDQQVGRILRDEMTARQLRIDTATGTQLDEIEHLVQQAERAAGSTFNDLAGGPLEGATLAATDPALTAARAAYMALGDTERGQVVRIQDAGVTLSLRNVKTQRRAAIFHTLVELAAAGMLDDTDDNIGVIVRALIAHAGGPPAAADAPLVAALELCDHRTAARLLAAARALVADRMHIVFTDDNTIALRLVEDEPKPTQATGATQ